LTGLSITPRLQLFKRCPKIPWGIASLCQTMDFPRIHIAERERVEKSCWTSPTYGNSVDLGHCVIFRSEVGHFFLNHHCERVVNDKQ
jgi:hypothetical protein